MANNVSYDEKKFRVLAEITSLGENYGFAEVISCEAGNGEGAVPSAGDSIYVLAGACRLLLEDMNGAWGPGSVVLLDVQRNLNVEHADKTPWAAAWVHIRETVRDSRCKRVTPAIGDRGVTTADRVSTKLKKNVAEVAEAWVMVDPERSDAEARKAAEDIKAAVLLGDAQAAQSALGRLRTRVEELTAPLLVKEAVAGLADEVSALLGLD